MDAATAAVTARATSRRRARRPPSDRRRLGRPRARRPAGSPGAAPWRARRAAHRPPSPRATPPAVVDGAAVPAPAYADERSPVGCGHAGGHGRAQPLATVAAARGDRARGHVRARRRPRQPPPTRLAAVAATHDATIASQITSSGDGLPVPMTADATGCDETGRVPCPTHRLPTTTRRRRRRCALDNDEVDALIARPRRARARWRRRRAPADDVTAQVADVDARVRRRARRRSPGCARSWTKATSRSRDVVTLEAELSRRQADLESLQAQQRMLADQTAQATVTVRLVDEQRARASVAGADRLPRRPDARAGRPSPARWSSRSPCVGALVPFLLAARAARPVRSWWLVRRAAAAPPLPRPAGRARPDLGPRPYRGSVCGRVLGVDEVDDAREHVGVGARQHAVAEVEHVARAAPRRRRAPARTRASTRPRRRRTARPGRGCPAARGRSPTRRAASDSGTRKSTPTTSAPASRMSASSSPVPTPKWIRGTPRSATAASARARVRLDVARGSRAPAARRPRSRTAGRRWRPPAPAGAGTRRRSSASRSSSACHTLGARRT